MLNGVVLYNKGHKCIPRLIVALRSLRKHYNGLIAVFLEGEDCQELGDMISKRFSAISIFDNGTPNMSALLRKIEIGPKTPFDNTVYLDADTLVVGKLDELFELAPQYDLVATNFADWKSDGGKIGSRTRRYQGLCPDHYIEDALKYGPAVNTGIYAYPKKSPIFSEWLDLAMKGEAKNFYIPDEIACQILVPQYNCFVAPTKFNISVMYDNDTVDKRVIHFHGRKHCIDRPLCRLWVAEFISALEENCCNIKKYIDRKYGDRRLSIFMRGDGGPKEMLPAVRKAIGIKDEPNKIQRLGEIANVVDVPIQEPVKVSVVRVSTSEVPTIQIPALTDKVTIVTAVDRKYLSHLRVSLPNWLKHKRLNYYPFLVYVNGFNGVDDNELNFLRSYENITVKEWNLSQAENQRENMISAFVLGTARDIQTPYWLKLDADAFAVDQRELINEEMAKYVICGHRWHYTKPWQWIQKLDEWAKTIPVALATPPMFDSKCIDGRRYGHARTASFVQLHQTEFVRQAAALAGERLPVPSHDTYLFYLASRLALPIYRHNFKRCCGMTNYTHFEDMLKADKLMQEQGHV
jgi:hypothetical protein